MSMSEGSPAVVSVGERKRRVYALSPEEMEAAESLCSQKGVDEAVHRPKRLKLELLSQGNGYGRAEVLMSGKILASVLKCDVCGYVFSLDTLGLAKVPKPFRFVCTRCFEASEAGPPASHWAPWRSDFANEE